MELSDGLLAEAIADYMVVRGCAQTVSGNLIFGFGEIAEHFGITEERVMELYADIRRELSCCPQVSDVAVGTGEREFDLMFYGDYCGGFGDDC